MPFSFWGVWHNVTVYEQSSLFDYLYNEEFAFVKTMLWENVKARL